MNAKLSCVRRFVAASTSVSAAILIFSATFAVAAEDVRTWADKTGKYKIQAKFVELSDNKVTLEREDGTRTTIPLDKLSEADQKFVADIQANPFKEVGPAKKSEGEPDAAADEGERKLVKPQWSAAKEIPLTAANENWSIAIDAPKVAESNKRRGIMLPAKRDFFDRFKGLVVNPTCRRAVVGYLWDKDKTSARLIVCDLEKAEVVASATAAGMMIPLSLNDAGTQVLMRRDDFGFGNADRLEIWSVAKGGVRKVLQWIPHDDQKGGDRDIKWGQYLGDTKLVTLSGSGRLTVWNAATAQPVCWLKIDGGCIPAVSTDRRYIAFAAEKQIGVFDLSADEVAALQPAPQDRLNWPRFVFTPKGTRLACSCGDHVYVWDMSTGALFRDLSLAGARINVGENLLCPSEDYVLANTVLIDIESQARLWTYQGHEAAKMLGDVCWFVAPAKDSNALVPAVLPQPSAVEKIQKAMEVPDFFVLKPGVTVKLNLAGLADVGEREKAAAALTKKLEANHCQVGPNGTVELVASTEAGKPREVAYHTFGGRGSRVYTVQEFFCRLKVVYQGQTAWEVSANSLPGFFRLEKGETMEQHLKASEHPNYAWFGTVELPKVVQKPGTGATTIGTTQITSAGIR